MSTKKTTENCTYLLHIYNGTTQKAVFTDVESFRDMSIGIEVEIEKRQSETFYKDDPKGGDKKQVVVEGCVREWINPDDPTTEAPNAPTMPRLLSALDPQPQNVGFGSSPKSAKPKR